jgi:Mannosyltransferase (PIG-V)
MPHDTPEPPSRDPAEASGGQTPRSLSRDAASIPVWLWTADALIALLVAMAAGVALFGGVLWSIGSLTLSLRSPARLIELAIAIVAITWIAGRGVPPWRRWQREWDAFGQRFPIVAAVLPIVIGTRLAILFVGLMAVKLIGLPIVTVHREYESIWPDDLINLPWRWDTAWFTGIAIDGYTWDPVPTHEQSIVFFPGFPMLMRLGATLVGHPESPVAVVWSGVVVSWITFLFACVYLFKLTREESGDEAGHGAVLLLAAYPFAVFFSTAYSESLFLFVVLATFYHFRRQELWLAALFGLATGLSRLNGCTVSVVLAAVIVFREWTPAVRRTVAAGPWRITDLVSPASLRAWIAASMPGIGMLIYCAFIWTLTGDPLAWLKRQAAWQRDIHLFDPRLALQFSQPRFWLDAVALAFVLIAIVPLARRLGYAAALFVALTTLLPFLNGGLLSVGRFTSIVFPLFIWLVLVVPREHRALVATIFGIGQALVACAFFTNRPLF